jgi:predicted RNA-binding Zn-ribbon protein involved in translation (DUF1610 family)
LREQESIEMTKESIKTGKICPDCGWDDGREFIHSFDKSKTYVCPKCSFMGTEIEWKRAEYDKSPASPN